MISAHLQESGDRNIYYWYYATQLLHNMKGAKVGALEPEDPRRPDRHAGQGRHVRTRELGPVPARPRSLGRHAGRLYLTSLSILTLEVYYRYLPLYRSFDEDQEKPEAAMKADGDEKVKLKDDDKPK